MASNMTAAAMSDPRSTTAARVADSVGDLCRDVTIETAFFESEAGTIEIAHDDSGGIGLIPTGFAEWLP